jgi:hypothetical protein
MKRTGLSIILLFLIASLSGCGIAASTTASPSNVMQSISLEALISANQGDLISQADLSSTTVFEPGIDFFQKEEGARLLLDPTNISAFMGAVRSEIEGSIASSEAEIIGTGGGLDEGSSFSIRYREDDVDGVINVWGVRGEGNSFTIILLITERFGR